MAGAVTVAVAVPVLDASACEVAVMVTVPPVGTVAGAVYSPDALIVPILAALADALLNCHVTAVFEVPLTTAVNCCVCPVGTLAVAGDTFTVIVGGVPPLWPVQAASTAASEIAIARNRKRDARTESFGSFTAQNSDKEKVWGSAKENRGGSRPSSMLLKLAH